MTGNRNLPSALKQPESASGAAPTPAADTDAAGGFSEIIEARAREYLASQAYHIAHKRHQRASHLRRAWVVAKAALAAAEVRHDPQDASHH